MQARKLFLSEICLPASTAIIPFPLLKKAFALDINQARFAAKLSKSNYSPSQIPPYGFFQARMLYWIKELPHNTAAHLAAPFPPVISCRFFDLPPVNLQNLQERLTENSLAS